MHLLVTCGIESVLANSLIGWGVSSVGDVAQGVANVN